MHCIDRTRRRLLRGAGACAGMAALAACHTPLPPDARFGGSVLVSPSLPPARLPLAMTMDDYRRQCANRMVAANPAITYLTPARDPLLAIPVLEIEVGADGSVRDIRVLRTPTQATDTVQIAIEAVRRAAPYGDPTRLPRPWKFTEVFLFDDDRRFKPRILD